MRVRWVSKQFSRFDLALVKMSRPLVAVNTISNLSVALVVGIWIFGVLFAAGFLVLVSLGYVLHKAGFFMQTTIETFDQQQKQLYQRQIRFMSACIATCDRMSPEELAQELQESVRGLRL